MAGVVFFRRILSEPDSTASVGFKVLVVAKSYKIFVRAGVTIQNIVNRITPGDVLNLPSAEIVTA